MKNVKSEELTKAITPEQTVQSIATATDLNHISKRNTNHYQIYVYVHDYIIYVLNSKHITKIDALEESYAYRERDRERGVRC